MAVHPAFGMPDTNSPIRAFSNWADTPRDAQKALFTEPGAGFQIFRVGLASVPQIGHRFLTALL
jgi:hypothetical protein